MEQQQVSQEETFEDYMLNARDEFVMAVKNEERSNFLLTAIDSFLICFDQMREKLTASPLPASSSIERFKMPTVKQMIDFAIVFNEGKIEKEKLVDMVGFLEMVIDRLYENGDILIPSSKENEINGKV